MAKFLKLSQSPEFSELMVKKSLAFLGATNSKVFPNAKTASGLAYA